MPLSDGQTRGDFHAFNATQHHRTERDRHAKRVRIRPSILCVKYQKVRVLMRKNVPQTPKICVKRRRISTMR